MLARVLCALLLTLVPGCGWYYLEPDPAQVAVGRAAPDFTLTDQEGQPRALDELLADGQNLALIFYRGAW